MHYLLFGLAQMKLSHEHSSHWCRTFSRVNNSFVDWSIFSW